jgi:hypothetical protein
VLSDGHLQKQPACLIGVSVPIKGVGVFNGEGANQCFNKVY